MCLIPFPCCRLIPHGRTEASRHDVRLPVQQRKPLTRLREILLTQIPFELPQEREVLVQIQSEVSLITTAVKIIIREYFLFCLFCIRAFTGVCFEVDKIGLNVLKTDVCVFTLLYNNGFN